ncbi:hypothetical protein AOCH_007147 [Aspergillus ochraceoroseus]|uniref:Uncharacterized protein n=1 Tax=Aspergillus ochraceoroseus TaxID=138278 RepID=A0A0F8VLU3_9EURO|nr:hypothetical protein AOCH_007147 [Aspergillus ochraceoroseus]
MTTTATATNTEEKAILQTCRSSGLPVLDDARRTPAARAENCHRVIVLQQQIFNESEQEQLLQQEQQQQQEQVLMQQGGGE